MNMATQSYYERSTKKSGVDVERLRQTQVPGHPPELQPKPGAEGRTPSPTRAPTSTADQARSTSWGRSDGSRDAGNSNPGKQGFGQASSLNPSEKAGPATIDPLGPAGADPILQNLRMGTARAIDADNGADWQTRNSDYADAKGFPPAMGMRPRGADGTIPKTTQPADGDEAARRQAGLKRTEQ